MIAPTEITNTSLLKEEHMWHTEMAGIVTITFVRGKNVSDNLKKRLVDVAQANPWICGHLTKGSPYHNLNIPTAEHAAKTVIERCFQEVSVAEQENTITLETPYSNICKTLKPYQTSKGNKLINQANESLFKVVVFKTPEDGLNAIMVDLSHVIADAGTYYAIFNMLNPAAEIITMNPQRKMELGSTGKQFQDLAGTKEANLPFGMGYMCNLIGSLMCGPKRTARAYKINMDKIADAKQKIDKSKVEYVSTNDLITSEFANISKPKLMQMAVDLRPHLTGLDKNDAGMYVSDLFFASKDDYSQPEAIRMALTNGRLRRAGHIFTGSGKESSIPGCCGVCCGTISMVTNWGSGQIDMSWGEDVVQELHLPIEIQMPVDVAMIFKYQPGKLGVILFTAKPPVFGENSQFGEPLAPKIFGVS